MVNNKQTSEIILYDRHEIKNDEFGSFMRVYGIGGNDYRIGSKRQDQLYKVFIEAAHGAPILIIYESFSPEGKPQKFIAGARVLELEDIVEMGLKTTLRKLLLAQDDERARSQALSYAKDIACAGKLVDALDPDEPLITEAMFRLATRMFAFIKGLPENTGEVKE